MFNTEKLIIEIQNRECLWKTSIKSYSDKVARRRAWEEIGEIFNSEWNLISPQRKQKIAVDDLYKKWKHIRDYYVREKRKERNESSGSAATKKRRCCYYDILGFLDVVKDEPRPSSSNVKSPVQDVHDESCDSENTVDLSSPGTRTVDLSSPGTPTVDLSSQGTHATEISSKRPQFAETTSPVFKKPKQNMTAFQKTLINMLGKSHSQKTEEEIDPNKSFLLSLLPEMKTLNERQNFEFKLGIMNLLKEIKYEN